MREFSHLTGVTIGGAAIVLSVGGFALAPAAGSHAQARHQAVAGYRATRVQAAGTVSQLAGRPAAAGAAAITQRRSPGIMPGGPMRIARARRGIAPTFAPRASEELSVNWGGYAAARRGRPFRFVQGTFFVPYVNCSTTPGSLSAHWIGLDGFSNDTVEQAGVVATCNGTTPEYAAWYETFPQFPVYPNIAIRAGDSITVSVFFRRSTRRFEISLTDTSNGAHFFRALGCPAGASCQRASAEAISEPPTSTTTGILPLADFRAESFTGVRVTDQAGHRGTLRSGRWSTVKIINVSQTDGAVIDQPTQLFQGTAFGNYWMRSR